MFSLVQIFIIRIILVLLNPISATVLMRFEKIPLWETLLFIIPLLIFADLATYCIGGMLAERCLKSKFLRAAFLRIKTYFHKATWDDALLEVLHIKGPLARLQNEDSLPNRFTRWVQNQKTIFICCFLCIPFLPYISAVATIALKRTDIRYKIPIIVCADIVRTSSMIAIIYVPLPYFR